MAKGMARAIPAQPKGRKRVLPASGSMFRAVSQLKCGTAPIQNTARITSDSRVMKTENLKVASTPTMLSPTNRT